MKPTRSKRLTTYLLFGLIGTLYYCYFFIPQSLSEAGGPCNAGIEVLVIFFVLILCSILLFFSLIGNYYPQSEGWKSASQACSILAFLLWGIFTLFHRIAQIPYFLPFLLLSAVTCWHSFRKFKPEE
jgi:uncharacterized membrane protein